MRSKDEVKKEMETNRDNFYKTTLCGLRKNNPCLEELMWKAIKTAKTKDFVQIKMVRLALAVLRAVGATDSSDPDYIKVQKGTIVIMDKYELWKENMPSGFSLGTQDLVAYANRKINKGDNIKCEDALNAMKKLVTAFYLEKTSSNLQ